MIPTQAIVASDDNPLYLDFWPIVSKLWRRLGIEPVLLYFGKQHPDKLNQHGEVWVFDPDEFSYNMPLATCWARYWFAAQEQPEKRTYIISDIDMLPFSKWYFIDQLKDIPEHTYVHINPCIDTYSRLPSCYHVSTPFLFNQILGIGSMSFKDSLNHVLNHEYDNSTCYIKGVGNDKWCFDEYYATERVLAYRGSHIVTLINRKGGQSGYRLDRTDWTYNPELLKIGHYFDSHSIRPYLENKTEIDYICQTILESND